MSEVWAFWTTLDMSSIIGTFVDANGKKTERDYSEVGRRMDQGGPEGVLDQGLRFRIGRKKRLTKIAETSGGRVMSHEVFDDLMAHSGKIGGLYVPVEIFHPETATKPIEKFQYYYFSGVRIVDCVRNIEGDGVTKYKRSTPPFYAINFMTSRYTDVVLGSFDLIEGLDIPNYPTIWHDEKIVGISFCNGPYAECLLKHKRRGLFVEQVR